MDKVIKDIRERIINGFSINRIPDKKKKWFIEFAREEFCDDRGLALSHLIDFYIGLIPSGIEHVEQALNELNERVKSLENDKDKEEPKVVRRMMDGRKIEEKKNE